MYTSFTFLQIISIHAPREGSDARRIRGEKAFKISIHAPREGSDGVTLFCKAHGDISIHAPREGSDCTPKSIWTPGSLFLSTLPARGATGRLRRKISPVHDFYPRSPRGERQRRTDGQLPRCRISIHAPREGSDLGQLSMSSPKSVFLSTLPARGATIAGHGRPRRA